MIGITLSSEQVRTAPPEVRRWIEHEVARSLGFEANASDPRPEIEQSIAICGLDELAAIFSAVQGAFPVVSVFFELGRKGLSFAEGRLEAYRLADIQHHTRLQDVEQVISCLDLINDVLQRIRGTKEAVFCGLDAGHCFIAVATQNNILRLWQDVIGRRSSGSDAETSSAAQVALPESDESLARSRAPAFVTPGAA